MSNRQRRDLAVRFYAFIPCSIPLLASILIEKWHFEAFSLGLFGFGFCIGFHGFAIAAMVGEDAFLDTLKE